MAGESTERRARARRERQANVVGGRPHTVKVKLTDAEQEALKARAAEVGVSVPRLLVESTLEAGQVEVGRAHAALQLLELDHQIRRIGANVNQLTRWAHQNREVADGTVDALHAVVRACLSVDATARWVMGAAPAVTSVSVDVGEDLPVRGEWADLDE
ncbi:plasmid mobilization protein [Nocardia cyriacigeorgica]|uniref:MobC family plasmid mobilization relaxosome protein n=1 Tax=Nocardia cyriacigeorgica TaxID=135487 RepID=A0A6P1DCN8_9NOCA|nr:plasmid mobilization relaxosome protein MobC [Nocardia cyriacigeorgica]NEW42515.1 MobC family plasmid mobilization relaxosome protein [Nocardia cyriacigeorgica]NEW47968.1 MobC family plasmid mobilization relaxosome protein [Nocardia cyriacigeorgica]